MPLFKLQFDPVEIPGLESRYLSRYAADDRDAEEAGRRAANAGHYSKPDFLLACRWKSPRTAKLCESNSDDFVCTVTEAALAAKGEQFKIEVLTLLHGVNWPTASVLLHLASEFAYPVLDFRALWSLGIDPPPRHYDHPFWMDYTAYCRELAASAGVSLRILDRALWEYSKEDQRA